MKSSKLQRCAHVSVSNDRNGKPRYYVRCDNLTSGKGATEEGKPVPLCTAHIGLYPKFKKKTP